jgi:hypothetical protein
MTDKTWPDAEIGEVLGSYDRTITAEISNKYLGAVEDNSPWYSSKSPAGTAIINPLMFGDEYVKLYFDCAHYSRNEGTLHSRTEHENYAVLPVGSTVKVSGRISDKFTRRGRRGLTIEVNVANEKGKPVSSTRITLVSIKVYEEK